MIVFTATDLQELNTQTPLSKDVPFDGDVSFIVTNISPAFFNVLDDLGKVQAIIPPWQIVQGNFNRNSLTLTVTVNYDLPLANSASASASQYALDVEVSNAATTPFSTQLPYANGVTQFSSVTNSSINVAGSVDANVTNAELVISGGVNASVTNASLDVNVPNGVQINNNSLNVVTGAGSQTTVANTIDVNMTGSTVTQDANVINDTLSTFSWIAVPQEKTTVTNLPNNSFAFFFAIVPYGNYDEIVIDIESTQGILNNYDIVLNQQRNNGQGGGSTYIFLNSSFAPKTGAYFDDVSRDWSSNGISLDASFPTNLFYITCQNVSGNTIVSDTLSLVIYLKYASRTITNPPSSPVNTQGVQGLPSSTGDLALPASTATIIPGSQNVVVRRLIISPGNLSGSTFPATASIWVQINGSLAFAIDISQLTNGQWMTAMEYDFDTGIATTSSGISLDPDISCVALVTIVTA